MTPTNSVAWGDSWHGAWGVSFGYDPGPGVVEAFSGGGRVRKDDERKKRRKKALWAMFLSQ